MPPTLKTPRPILDLTWLSAVFTQWVVIVTAMAMAWQWGHMLGYYLAVFVIGTRQHALAILGHDATHFHVSRSRRINDLAAYILVACPIGYSFSGYRRWHFEHHRTVGSDGNPELNLYRRFDKKWSADANRFKLFVTDLLGCGSYEAIVLWDDLMRWRPLRRPWQRVAEEFSLVSWPISAACLIGVTCGWWTSLVIAVLWYGALFTSFFAVYRLRCYTEHVGSGSTHRLSQPPLWQRLLHLPSNTWLHWEHHTWPSIPLRQFKQAPELFGRMTTRRDNEYAESIDSVIVLEASPSNSIPVRSGAAPADIWLGSPCG